MTTKISEMTPSPTGLDDGDLLEISRPGSPNVTYSIDAADIIAHVLGGGSVSGTNTGDQNLFSTIAVATQSNVVADSTTDTLTLVAGTGITITTNAATDAITITNSGAVSDSFKTISVSGQSDVIADSGTDTLTLVAGSGVAITTNAGTDTITFTATGSGGTVTHTGGALTANAVVLGAGSADTKVVAGIITDGTSIVELGVAGSSVGKVTFRNATSGSITLQPATGALGTVTLTAPATTGTLALLSDLTSGYQPLDSDLTTIAGLTATTDNFIQSKSSAWASRTVAQVAADLSSSIKPTEAIVIAASDESTALTAGTSKVTFRMPFAFTVSAVRASLTTAQTSGSIFTVDINESGTSIISTKITIDNTEKTSTTAATPPVISDSSLADDAEMTVDIDQVGDGTAKGLKIYLIGSRT